MAGIAHEELPASGRRASSPGWRRAARVRRPAAAQPAVHPRLERVGPRPGRGHRPSMRARQRETALTGAIYRHHPRFAGTPLLYGGEPPRGVVRGRRRARCSPRRGRRRRRAADDAGRGRGVRAARLRRGAARTVLAVPIAQERATMHLDTVCTMVDVDAVVMFPAARRHARGVDRHGRRRRRRASTGPSRSSSPPPRRWSIDALRVIDTGLDPVTAEREQWDDGNNTLALAPGLVGRLRAQRRDQRTGSRRPASRSCASPAASSAAAAAAALHVLPGNTKENDCSPGGRQDRGAPRGRGPEKQTTAPRPASSSRGKGSRRPGWGAAGGLGLAYQERLSAASAAG